MPAASGFTTAGEDACDCGIARAPSKQIARAETVINIAKIRVEANRLFELLRDVTPNRENFCMFDSDTCLVALGLARSLKFALRNVVQSMNDVRERLCLLVELRGTELFDMPVRCARQ